MCCFVSVTFYVSQEVESSDSDYVWDPGYDRSIGSLKTIFHLQNGMNKIHFKHELSVEVLLTAEEN